MLNIDATWLTQFDHAIEHDQLQRHHRWIQDQANAAEPELHQQMHTHAQYGAWLDTIMHDAAPVGYQASQIPVLYHQVLRSGGLYYQAEHFQPLFQHRWLHPQDRLEQLKHLWELDQRYCVEGHPWYQGLQQDPLPQRFRRLASWYHHQQQAQSQQDDDMLNLNSQLFIMDYQALLLALTADALQDSGAAWQSQPCESGEMVAIASAQHRRRLTLQLGETPVMNATAQASDQEQQLTLTLPVTWFAEEAITRSDQSCTSASSPLTSPDATITPLQQCLHAYVTELAPAQALATPDEKDTTSADSASTPSQENPNA